MKKILIGAVLSLCVMAHPVSYTIDLEVSYDKNTKIAEIKCSSNSRNKCGLYNIKLLDKDEKEILIKRFPFLKKSMKVKVKEEPKKLEFFLRKTPEHIYVKIFE